MLLEKNSDCYNRPLYRAIRKYGIENFDFVIIELCKPEDLNDKEIYWIKYYNSYEDVNKGYNLTPGGHAPVIAQPLEIYKMWDEGMTIAEIIEETQLNKSTIHKYLVLYKNFSTTEARSRGVIKSLKKNKNIKSLKNDDIIQYDLEGNYIKNWGKITLNELERQTGYNHKSISKCLKGEYYSSYNYRWAYEGEKLKDKKEFYSNKYKRGDKVGNSTIQINENDILYIKKELAKGITQQQIADSLNISRHIVTKINNGNHYNDGGIYPIYDKKKHITNRPELLENN